MYIADAVSNRAARVTLDGTVVDIHMVGAPFVALSIMQNPPHLVALAIYSNNIVFKPLDGDSSTLMMSIDQEETDIVSLSLCADYSSDGTFYILQRKKQQGYRIIRAKWNEGYQTIFPSNGNWSETQLTQIYSYRSDALIISSSTEKHLYLLVMDPITSIASISYITQLDFSPRYITRHEITGQLLVSANTGFVHTDIILPLTH
jgi:hypothetical protein